MKNGAVHLFVFDGMADWEAAFAVAAINNPLFQLHPGRYRVVTTARSLKPITTMGGVRILPETTIDEITPCTSSMLILPGGQAWEEGGNLEALERALCFVNRGVPVAAICGATLALARAGLLDDRRHTSNDAAYLETSGYRGANYYCQLPAVTYGNLITASGTAPIEFAYEIAKMLDLYPATTLDGWYALYKYGNAAKLHELMAAQYA